MAGASGIQQFESRVFSQHREDGVIERLLSEWPGLPQSFVEFGFAPQQCNCVNLVVNHGYQGLFIDGNPWKCEDARFVFDRVARDRVTVEAIYLNVDNLMPLLARHGLDGEIGVLSIDVDGNDYWLWDAITAVPRVVVIEYNASFGPDRSITVTYQSEFDRYALHPSGFYHGASLTALERLGQRKGYRLVGVDSSGVNAFFVHSSLDLELFPTVRAADAYRPHRGRTRYKKIPVK